MKKKKWVQGVTTDYTSPPEGIFVKDAETIRTFLPAGRKSSKEQRDCFRGG